MIPNFTQEDINNWIASWFAAGITQGSITTRDAERFFMEMMVAKQANNDIITITCNEMARPSDTTAYAAYDVIMNTTTPGSQQLIEIPNIARTAGGGFLITGITVSTDLKNILPDLRVKLYNASNPTIPVDNAPSTTIYANNSKFLGYVDLDTMISGTDTTNSTSSFAQKQGNILSGVCAEGQTSLWCYLVTKTAFTPASGQKFQVKVTARRS